MILSTHRQDEVYCYHWFNRHHSLYLPFPAKVHAEDVGAADTEDGEDAVEVAADADASILLFINSLCLAFLTSFI